MILVRDIFHLKFGKAREALNLWKEGLQIMNSSGFQPDRILTDLSGEYYTLVLESTYDSLSDYENAGKSETMTDEWRKWYQRFIELVIDGRREIFNIVPVKEPAKTSEKPYATANR